MARIRMTPVEEVLLEFRRRGNVWESVVHWRRRLGRKILTGAAMVAAVCVILMIGAMAGLYAARPQLDGQSQAFANASINAIVPAWNEDELFDRASSKFFATRTQIFDDYFSRLQTLGPGSSKDSCIGSAVIDPMSIFFPVTAIYTCEIQIKSTPAVAILSLRREAGVWKIMRFYVSADQLM